MKTAPRITLSDEERSTLEVWLRLATSRRLALRVKIVLAAAEGWTNQEIARRLKISPKTVSLWRRRFRERRLAGIEKEAPRRRSAEATQRLAHRIVKRTVEQRAHARRWSTRSLARELGVSPSTVQRVWQANGLNCRK